MSSRIASDAAHRAWSMPPGCVSLPPQTGTNRGGCNRIRSAGSAALPPPCTLRPTGAPLARTSIPLPLAGQVIGITGAGGTLGSVLLDQLTPRTKGVVPLFTRENQWSEYCAGYATSGARPLHARLPDHAAQAALLEHCDTIFHLGAWSHPRTSSCLEDLRNYLLNNAVPAAVFVQLAARRGTAPRLVFASSIQVYDLARDPHPRRPLKESDLQFSSALEAWLDETAAWMLETVGRLHTAADCEPALLAFLHAHPPPSHADRPYPLSKALAERILNHYENAISLRLAGAHGPSYDPRSIATMRRLSPEEMLHSAMNDQPIEYPDASKHSMWIGNTWRALLRAAIVDRTRLGEVRALNVGARQTHPGKEYAEIVRDVADADSDLVSVPWHDRALLDLSLTESVLGFTFTDAPLEEDLFKLHEWVCGRLHVGPWSDRFIRRSL